MPADPTPPGDDHEKWLYANPETLESVRRGLREAAAGEVHDLDSLVDGGPPGDALLDEAIFRARAEAHFAAMPPGDVPGIAYVDAPDGRRAAAEMPLTRAETELTPDEDTALGAEAVRGIKASRERRYGLLRELGHVDSRFDDPLPEHELRRWEGATDA